MKILTIQASSRKSGNTDKMLEWAEEELSSAGHETERLNLCEFTIKDCNSVGSCQKLAEIDDCTISDDDGNMVMAKMREADAIIFGTPLYCWSFPSILKSLFDRCLSQVRDFMAPDGHRSSLQGKYTALLVTCGGPVEQNADLIGPNFDRICRFVLLDKKAELIQPFCTEPDGLDDTAKENACKLARKLVS